MGRSEVVHVHRPIALELQDSVVARDRLFTMAVLAKKKKETIINAHYTACSSDTSHTGRRPTVTYSLSLGKSIVSRIAPSFSTSILNWCCVGLADQSGGV